MRVLSIDVGLVNCSFCLLESERSDLGPSLQCLQSGLADGSILLRDLQLVAFGKKATAFQTVCENVVQFATAVLSQSGVLETVDLCVIEMQMTARMKAISSALYAAIRCLRPSCTVLFQSACAKLSFGDLCGFLEEEDGRDSPPPPSVQGSSYSQRKRLAVLLAKRLLLLSAAVSEDIKKLFVTSKKKDDLADALLHALAALCTKRGPSSASRIAASSAAPKKRATTASSTAVPKKRVKAAPGPTSR